MTIEEQQRVAISLVVTSLVSSVITGYIFRRAFDKRIKKVKTVLDSQHELIQWTANHILDLDREDFAKQFTVKALFLNIVIQET